MPNLVRPFVGFLALMSIVQAQPAPAANPLLSVSPLPLAYPQFDKIKDEHYAPAYERGMTENLAEVAAIATNAAPATFDNTIVALERSGQLLGRVSRIFSNINGCNTNPTLQAVEKTFAPKLAAHRDAILLNAALFARVRSLHEARTGLSLDPESARLLDETYKSFVRAGARLSETDKTKLKALNAEIASAETAFSQNVLKERTASAVYFNDRAALAGLSETEITAAAELAKSSGRAGQFALALINTSGQPALTSLTDRTSRELILRASLARGSRGGEFDNRANVATLARLRAERAALLGYATHADYVLEDQTAKNVAAAKALLAQLAPPAVANARKEAADIQQIIDAEFAGKPGRFTAAASDWDLYSEKVRTARYAFDEAQVKPYFELNHVLVDGAFFAATKLFGITFKERTDLPVYRPEVRVFEVFNANGATLALFIFDAYARPSKNGGAWMNEYESQSALLGTKPVVGNHLNIPQPPAGEPTLLTFDEVTTLFHEFGHALHGMFSDVKYPRFSGTSVPSDFVEFPSQVNEMWAVWPEILKNYAKHYKTGEPLPAALLAKVLDARKFNQGYVTTEYLAAALLDLTWHGLKPAEVPAADGVLAFEAAALKKVGLDFAPVPPRYRSTYFSHVFSGGYSAGYYSYIWSEVLDATTVEWFKQNGGLTRANGDRFRAKLLARGGTADALGLFRDFTGGEADIKPLLVRRGLDAPATASVPAANPLLTPSPLPFNYPPFNLIKNEHYLPAYEAGMTENLSEISAIAQNPAPATFDNTIVALERSGRLLARVATVFGGLSGANTNPEMQKIQRTMSPRLAAHSDAIRLNAALFARIASLYAARASLALDPESDRLLWRTYQDFVRAGAKLGEADKAKLRALNSELATLQTTFTQNVLKERDASGVLFDTRAELDGLSDTAIATAAAAAKATGHDGKFLIALVNTTGQPPLTDLKNHAARVKLIAASLTRGSRGGDYDNRAVVSAIAKKRAARAALLGYAHHAAYQLEEQTVGSVEVLNKLLAQLAPPAVANARKEAADMQAIVDAEKGGFTLSAADWDRYTEKVRAARYAFDESQLRPYYELNRVLIDGVFFAATKLYGITFKERHDLPVYEATVRTFDVFNADGSALAIFFFDPYARSNKNGGAWANSYSSQSHLLGTRPVIGNHLNIPQPPAGQPTLLTHSEVNTAFHEFGHALHGMFSNVKYPRFSGTSVPRDFVEFPSQVNEMWATWPEILQNYAKHYQTGAPLPAELLAKVQAAAKFNQGFKTTEYLAATLLDQAWHQVSAAEIPEADGVLAFEAAALKKYGVDFTAVPPRYRSTYFSHTFSGGYSAGYYSYIWSEVLDADTVEWIKQNGGLQRANGDRFRAKLLSRGGTADALGLFRDFTGGEPDIKPLLVRRGLETPARK